MTKCKSEIAKVTVRPRLNGPPARRPPACLSQEHNDALAGFSMESSIDRLWKGYPSEPLFTPNNGDFGFCSDLGEVNKAVISSECSPIWTISPMSRFYGGFRYSRKSTPLSTRTHLLCAWVLRRPVKSSFTCQPKTPWDYLGLRK